MAVKANISTIRSIIKTNEKIRDIAFGDVSLHKEETKIVFMNIFQDTPKLNDWRVYDHCAVVTRLYAIYETFVEDLIRDWLIILQELFPSYSDLDESIRNTHQNGVGRLLIELKKNRYSHLTVEEVTRGLFYGNTGEGKYELLPDAFLFHEQNLRKDTLNKLLTDAGVPNTWSWILKNRYIMHFVKEIRANENSVENELDTFISYRNDAAHGTNIDDFLAANALLELCDFVEALCQALSELVTYQVIEKKKLIGQIQEIGKITEWYQEPKAAILTANGKDLLSIGDSLFLVGKFYCQLAKIESIQSNGESINEIETTSGMELGLKFDVDARKDLCLYQLTN
ncbi:MAE_28990/MAE_18760 family HEPN-like nuclease [Anabaena lutea]|nr:MAE_28990/MAE_18760 family HEPN-like nuclease [Anabaena lutea]